MKIRIVVAIFVSLFAWDAFACIHAKIGETIEQNRFRIALAHKDGVQTTVIQPNVSVKKATDMGWVFPVPKMPKTIDVGAKRMLVDLGDYLFETPSSKLRGPKKKGLLKGGSKIIVHPTLDVGPFKITPVEGGYDGVSKWLKKNKYQPIPKDHLKPYLDKGFIILAAKVKVKSAGSGVDLPPIILQFESETIQFPLMFERTNTVTDFEFYLFTTTPFSKESLDNFWSPEDENSDPYVVFASRSHALRVAEVEPKDLLEPFGSYFQKLGFAAEDTIYVERLRIGAASHEKALKAGIPDVSLPVPSETDDIKDALTQLDPKTIEPKEKAPHPAVDPNEPKPQPSKEKEEPAPVDVSPASCMTGGGVGHARLACLLGFLLLIARRRRD